MIRTFGKKPKGEDLLKVTASENFRGGMFQNIDVTRQLKEDVSMFKISMAFFNKPKNVNPDKIIPSVKTNLKNLPDGPPVIVWFGHSSYLIKTDGLHILVDPVFSGYASPFSFSVKAFEGSNVYDVHDMPPIDALILTHDHYDHLDYKTLGKLKNKVKHIYTSLGVASHLKYWGFGNSMITEFDWGTNVEINETMQLTATPARHFSGRGFVRAKTLWSSFVLQTSGFKIFIGADSGYGKHFKEIGEKHGPFDIAMLECGQYNDWWPEIHMTPEETVQAGIDLGSKVLFPVHWGKFALAFHAWDESINRFIKTALLRNITYVTPMIGEATILDNCYPQKNWWQTL